MIENNIKVSDNRIPHVDKTIAQSGCRRRFISATCQSFEYLSVSVVVFANRQYALSVDVPGIGQYFLWQGVGEEIINGYYHAQGHEGLDDHCELLFLAYGHEQ